MTSYNDGQNQPYSAQYARLEDTTNFSCDQQCLCRHTSERSTKDIMDYNYYVMGQPMMVNMQNGNIHVNNPMNFGQNN